MAELADIDVPKEREALLLQRQQEVADSAHEIRRSSRRALGRNLPSWSLGLVGSAWSAVVGDPLGTAFSTLSSVSSVLGLKSPESDKVTTNSYLFRVECNFSMRDEPFRGSQRSR